MYFEDRKIIEIQDGLEEGYKRVICENGSFDIPEWELEAVKTEEISSMSNGSYNRSIAVARKLLDVLESLDVRIDEIRPCIERLVESIRERELKSVVNAMGFKATTEDAPKWSREIRLSHWDRVCK